MKFNKLACKLDDAAKNAQAIEQITNHSPLSLDEAYAIQSISISRRLERGEKFIGIKLGFTSKAKMEQMGIHDIIWGKLTSGMVIKANQSISLGQYIHPRAEPEIGFRIGEGIEAADFDPGNARACVDAVCVAIEIIDSRFENFKFTLEDVIADNCSSTGLVLGDWYDPTTPISKITMRLKADETILEEGNSSAILGDPWAAFDEGIRLAFANGIDLKKGHIILAGAATSARYLSPNQNISAEADGLGQATFTTRE